MARIFITGSADGLGKMAGELLLQQGHSIVFHARNHERAEVLKRSLPTAETIVIGDLASIRETHSLAAQVNALGRFDAVIHNAAVGYKEPSRTETADGLSHVFAVNSLAPYILTALMEQPTRLVYMSSRLHESGDASLDDLSWSKRRWAGTSAYSDTKLHNVLLAFAVARRWPHVFSYAVEPGWVATKMGGVHASDDLDQGHRTQAWLAASDDPAAKVTGEYLYHMQPRTPLAATRNIARQEKLLAAYEQVSGVPLAPAQDVTAQ